MVESNKVKASMFLENFEKEVGLLSEVNDYNTYIDSVYKKNKNWTLEMKKIVTNTISLENYMISTEYHNQDVSSHEEEKMNDEIFGILREFNQKIKYAIKWSFDVGVELENDHNSWIYELKQLMEIHSKLRILISYQSFSEELLKNICGKDSNKLEKLINYYKQDMDYEGNEFVIIFGNRYDKGLYSVVETNQIIFDCFTFKCNNREFIFQSHKCVKTDF